MKYVEYENAFKTELFKTVFVEKLQAKLNSTFFEKGTKKLSRECTFQESLSDGSLGITFALKLANIPEKTDDPNEQTIFKKATGHIVLSIHALIKEQEIKPILRSERVTKHLELRVLVSKTFFENIHDKGLKDCMESLKPELESESGLDTSFIFKEIKE